MLLIILPSPPPHLLPLLLNIYAKQMKDLIKTWYKILRGALNAVRVNIDALFHL